MNKEKLMIKITRLTKLPSWVSDPIVSKRVTQLGKRLWKLTNEGKGRKIKVTHINGETELFQSFSEARKKLKMGDVNLRKYLDSGIRDAKGRLYESY